MEILRKLRWVLYPSAFILVFFFGAYCSFPKSVLREMSESSLTYSALNYGPKNRGLVQVSMKNVSLWRLFGVSISGLKFLWPGTKSQSPLTIELDYLQGRVGLWSMLSGSKSMHMDSSLYDGYVEVDVGMRKNNILRFVDIGVSNLNLGKMAFLESLIGAPLVGITSLAVDLVATTEMTKDGSGTIKLNIDNLGYGPGNINLPTGGFVSALTVPKLSLGKLSAELSLEKGELSSKSFTLQGGDVEGDLKINMILGPRPDASRLDGHGWFSLKPELVSSNETIKMLYDLIPELKQAEQNRGRVGFAISGSIVRPQFRLEAYQGE